MKECMRVKDDATLRRLRKMGAAETQKQRAAGTETALLLRKRAQEIAEEDAKRRRANQEEARLAANEAEAAKAETARAQQAAAEARNKTLQQIIINRRVLQQQREGAAKAKAHSRWIQVTFPAELAAKLIRSHRRLKVEQKKNMETMINEAAKAKFFQRHPCVPDLWVVDDALLIKIAQVAPPGASSGRRHWVRCAPTFENEVRKVWTDTVAFGPDPVSAMRALLRALVPAAGKIFADAYTPLKLLHMNDYVMEKAFVFAVIALSKWLGPDRWPMGFYETWPPPLPLAAAGAPGAEDVDLWLAGSQPKRQKILPAP